MIKLLKVVFPLLAILIAVLIASAQTQVADSPSVISAVAPVYPPIARAANASGDATVEVQIDRDGKVVSVESKSGHPLLQTVAEEAARRWIFSTATADNNRKASLVFAFRSLPSQTPASEGTSVYYPPYKIEARAIAPIVNP